MRLSRTILLSMSLLVGLAASAPAQDRFEIFGAYSYLHFSPTITGVNSRSFNGGGGAATLYFLKIFGEPGHDDHRYRQAAIPDLLDKVQPADPRQPQVGQDQRARVLHQPFEGGRAVAGNRDLPAGKGEKLGKLLANQLAVVHHEDASFHGAFIHVEAGGLILVVPSNLGRLLRCFDAVFSNPCPRFTAS